MKRILISFFVFIMLFIAYKGRKSKATSSLRRKGSGVPRIDFIACVS